MQPFHPQLHSPSIRPATPDSPSFEKESHFGPDLSARQARELAQGVVREYEVKRDKLDNAIKSSEYLVADVRNFNANQWAIRYPHLRTVDEAGPPLPHRPGMARRTLTFADEPAEVTDVVLNSSSTVRQGLKRSLTVAPPPSTSPATISAPNNPPLVDVENDEEDFSILRLDLNLGATRQAQTLINQLEKASISALLDTRLAAALDHLQLLQKRVNDPQSRVLITGDLNAGKSTLVNALLRRNEVMPTDQQPLTTRFVEVVSARENGDKEEIHMLAANVKYDPANESTYSVEDINRLEELVTDLDADASSPPLRVFLKEADSQITNPSILHNGVIDISLIDAPGLNRDSVKTTANFARQEEIDVVVFVVSAANHFTLSAKEFIWQAGHEKAHLFIVVNRFDQIRDKERCRRLVLEQIKQLSPSTFEDAADLVHFVDSAKVAFGCTGGNGDAEELDHAFEHLEHSLRSFVLVNRAKSKLGPAQNYVTHLLADVELLASANSLVAQKEREAAKAELERTRPILEKMQKGKDGFEESLVAEEETTTEQAISRTRKGMQRALERVSKGEMAAPAPGLEMPSYPGLLGVWDYAKEVRRVLLASLDFATTLSENDARRLTTEGVNRVAELGDTHLPKDVERSKRVFNSNAMFSARPVNRSRRQSGVGFIGLGLAAQTSLAEPDFMDILDLSHHLFVARAALPSSMSSSHELVPFAAEMSGLGAFSLGVGALSMVSGKSVGLRSVLEGAIHVTELASNPAVRKWIGPVLGVVTLGAVGWVILELPRSIPRNVGRHLQTTLTISSGVMDDSVNVPFVEAQAARVGKEVRKVMRLAAWELRERFKNAVDARGEVVRESEETEKRAVKALAWFTEVEKRVEVIRQEVAEVKV
ncbi:hypothetical protein TREMEDRAFT_45398 [Tremella mesenterica DSM 1558]|uniref:uncharacterized protein n=1 Tax=Tremella mesenterica (strain ATCC 24925 / CBS 8224 / DSM 1558 / NBRC 9311 / NRRL Y-6157 / RJB 2259-6 / UBC 559-6) TaxID=578456 RepID=UPI0003F49BA2|nr:uncharacterized protein TREMEDRAFT_45398 [Tremella mesenterica DSM 1558]EIW66868.1 hypothetical protein TREMEDRAFT_45398 [Tremella mesenterica DSM 1558]